MVNSKPLALLNKLAWTYVSGSFTSTIFLEKGGPICCFIQYIKYKSGVQPMHSSRNGAHKITRSPGFPCLCLSKPPDGATLLSFLRPWGIFCGRKRRDTGAHHSHPLSLGVLLPSTVDPIPHAGTPCLLS